MRPKPVGNKHRNLNASASFAGTIPVVHGLITANFSGSSISGASKPNNRKGSFKSNYTTGLKLDMQQTSSPTEPSTAATGLFLTAKSSAATQKASQITKVPVQASQEYYLSL